jgi:hypothetical protein
MVEYGWPAGALQARTVVLWVELVSMSCSWAARVMFTPLPEE